MYLMFSVLLHNVIDALSIFRENSTLHHQVEQMLQKISPLQKCQEELGSLKAELEEKKVTKIIFLEKSIVSRLGWTGDFPRLNRGMNSVLGLCCLRELQTG